MCCDFVKKKNILLKQEENMDLFGFRVSGRNWPEMEYVFSVPMKWKYRKMYVFSLVHGINANWTNQEML